MAEDAVAFLQSRPLIDFHMDGAHLNNVLQRVLRQQQQLQQAHELLSRRLDDVEHDVKDVRHNQDEVAQALADTHVARKSDSDVAPRVAELERALDHVVHELEASRKALASTSGAAEHAGQFAEQAHRSTASLQETVRRVAHDVDVTLKQCAQERKSTAATLDELARSHAAQERRLDEALAEVQQKADRMTRERSSERLRQLLDELSDRTDDNFRSVEESARAVDAELSRQNGELAALRAALAACEETTRSRLAAIAADADERYEALLSSFGEYERTAQELHSHFVLAGQALARGPLVRAGATGNGGAGGSASRLHSPPSHARRLPSSATPRL